ncbi:MAG TPA: T9SS type A sorting domain-containing protein, partial [Chitinophagaceae bacterium]|nr:T9SS type A sorting domain-containing protein [Chitinophagaceae bacterium]
FPANRVAVYRNLGICSNSIGANALGTEFNGTFGGGKDRYRGASSNVPAGYTYSIFNNNMPNDYYYGVANNTSTVTGYTTSNAWPKPDGATPTRRVFTVWDIIGDHTGAADPLQGNPAADTVASSNGGYMLVINAAYRIDSAFQQTISGLCPNTYYEISCWMRNICSRCGCDSAGRGAGSAGYIATAPGDSSGVYPNVTFEVDGVDYYSTGDITYSGQWVKKGFTFLTGPGQTSFTLKFFNNAPGGGGNDWALDDISVATCSPNLLFTPSNAPTYCAGSMAELSCTVRSYFNNYVHYKWERSTDGGLNWTAASANAIGTPAQVNGAWEYTVQYPPFVVAAADSGLKYRLVVATTNTNLANGSCASSNAMSVVTLNVIDCGAPLSTRFVSVTGKADEGTTQLHWVTDTETEAVTYTVERSTDGLRFTDAGVVTGGKGGSLNTYSWSEPQVGGTRWYRIRMNGQGLQKYSRILRMAAGEPKLTLQLTNPFAGRLPVQVTVSAATQVRLDLIDNSGRTCASRVLHLAAGTHALLLEETAPLPAGIYTVRLSGGTDVVTRKVVKTGR